MNTIQTFLYITSHDNDNKEPTCTGNQRPQDTDDIKLTWPCDQRMMGIYQNFEAGESSSIASYLALTEDMTSPKLWSVWKWTTELAVVLWYRLHTVGGRIVSLYEHVSLKFVGDWQ